MPKIAFLFPGQGSQFVGMGRELDQELPAVRALFDRAGEILGIDLRRLCLKGPPMRSNQPMSVSRRSSSPAWRRSKASRSASPKSSPIVTAPPG